MFRPAARALARAPTVAARTPANRRLISTGPTKSRSWKNTFLRLGLAGGAIYYYNTSSVFSEEPKCTFRRLELGLPLFLDPEVASRDNPVAVKANETLDSVTPKIRQERAAAQAQKSESAALEGGLNAQELEEEAGQEAAFNPETGEINWDCPCLGGMAHGPCGEDFKAAFSCFVYSEEEPKGIDCIEKFKAMQDCFRQYPEVYGAELEDDDEPQPQSDAPAPSESPAPSEVPATSEPSAAEVDVSSHPTEKQTRAEDVNTQAKADNAAAGESAESDSLIPKAAHDTEEKNQASKA
ncbi:hypothetical protein PENNAL_c0043G02737 [Penicillium nalgiovense]|uniref:Mitochondrial intermembrane space import and assembly protein 40 n=1 Tax=Penicillium nalgiovense TaxID=60175 RepID=A0A1V6Y0T6_PENNA|nr:hypothetical protein PENNAL_c0043G02737 [Penicillium nalgiovense]